MTTVAPRIEFVLAQIRSGRLQRLEKKADGVVLDLPGEQQTHDLHERQWVADFTLSKMAGISVRVVTVGTMRGTRRGGVLEARREGDWPQDIASYLPPGKASA
jgi:hypothetical protein